jgi:hypothetical protein
MTWPYHYTPTIWPMLASAVFMAALGIYARRCRRAPGALPPSKDEHLPCPPPFVWRTGEGEGGGCF